MVRYHASWVLPIVEPPIRDGWIVADRGRIVAYGAYGAVTRRAAAHAESAEVDLGHVAVLPGLVNAHTHLELSYLRDEVPPASEFVAWIRNVMAARRQQPHAAAPVILEAIDRAIAESVAFGTAVVGDISNTLVPFRPLAAQPARGGGVLRAAGFQHHRRRRRSSTHACRELEALGAHRSRAHQPGGARARTRWRRWSSAPSARRSIAIRSRPAACICRSRPKKSSSSGPAAVRGGSCSRRSASGTTRGARPASARCSFSTTAVSSNSRVLAVHGVQMTPEDLARLAARGRDARHLSAQQRPHRRRGATDRGLLRVRRARRHRHRQPGECAGSQRVRRAGDAARAGAVGARIEAAGERDDRRRARRSASTPTTAPSSQASRRGSSPSTLPEPSGDVEEYLVSGVQREQIRWVDDRNAD